MKIAILGFGTIGGGIEAILRDMPDVSVKRIFSRHVPEKFAAEASDFASILQDEEIDTVAEALGGVEPAYSYLCEAIRAGKNAVTANKAVVAAHYADLAALAAENGVAFRFSAAVGGGIPWLPNLERLKRADRPDLVGGIMNGTCNYILTRMVRDGAGFAEALASAQEKGFAERDPSADIDGLDARRKLLISANTAFDCVLSEEEIPAFGIRHIRPEDFAAAAQAGKTVRLVNRAFREPDGRIRALTAPAFVPLSGAEAAVWENENRIFVRGERAGLQSFGGLGAGRYPTALNLVQDLLDLGREKKVYYQKGFAPARLDDRGWLTRWYIRDLTGSRITEPADTAETAALLQARLAAGEAVFAAVMEEGSR
ncbi:MAG: homoserine dehydrogenase [Lachnospiraceae bacterium]|nr:homoserine dehydrogenase [Lachnospiraceae bacterium]